AAGSRQDGPPGQYQRQRQQSQLQQDIRSSWRWSSHRPHELTGHSQKSFQSAVLTLALERLLARRPEGHPRHPFAQWAIRNSVATKILERKLRSRILEA